MRDGHGRTLVEGLSQAAQVAGVPHYINHVGSMWTLFFTDGPVTDYDSAKRSDTPVLPVSSGR
jgi:glutamate-1-semialdehyde 2,1-aminomutase